MRIYIAIALSIAVLPAVARITENCNPNYGSGEVIVATDAETRRQVLAIVADPASNPDIFSRLWSPRAARATTFLAFENEVILSYDPAQDTGQISSELNADSTLRALSRVGAWSTAPNTRTSCFIPVASPLTVTEYYNRISAHYFMSASASENAIIDRGGAGPGWERTGEVLAANQADACLYSHPVFRFYGPGPNSHFFTASPQECGLVRNRDPGWIYEGEAFGAYYPIAGICPGPTTPVYRLYNGRAAFNDSNHRHVTRMDLYLEMQRRGWIGEGLAMCVGSPHGLPP